MSTILILYLLFLLMFFLAVIYNQYLPPAAPWCREFLTLHPSDGCSSTNNSTILKGTSAHR